jgi:hypothetical protein
MKSKIVLGLAVVALAFAPAKKAELIFKLEEGKTYNQIITEVATVKQTIQEQETVTDQNTMSSLYIKFKETSSDLNSYTVWYDSLEVNFAMGGQEQSFSSDTSGMQTVDPLSKMLSGLTGEQFDVGINNSGSVKNVEGLDVIIKNLTEGLTGQAAMMAAQVSKSFGNEEFSRGFETGTAIAPASKVKPGDTWTEKQYLAGTLPLMAENTYTLESVSNGVASINLEATLSLDPENSTTTMQGMQASYYLDGARTGNYEVEMETGWVTNAEVTDEVVGSITFAPNEQMPEGMSIPLEKTSTTTIKGMVE